MSVGKSQRSIKQSLSHKKYWSNMSEEERKTGGDKIRAGIANMSEEDKFKRSKNSSIATKKHMAGLTDDEKAQRALKVSEYTKMRYATMSDEERKAIGRNISKGQNNMSDEEKTKLNMQRSVSLKKYWKNMSVDQRNKISDTFKQWWKDMTPEQYQRLCVNRAMAYNEYINSLDIVPNNNEMSFINDLNMNGIVHQYIYPSAIIHKDFLELFPYNPITGSDRINPFHNWDFKLNLKQKTILVDVDGSIHNQESYRVISPYTNKEYSMLDYHKFNDSKRPYQTDGLDAYIIQCYDDELKNDTKVLCLQTNKYSSYEQFMALLRVLNMDTNDQKKAMKEWLS